MNLTEQLEELAEADAPPMLIDIDRARATGRRRRMRRRTALVGGITAVALTGALITPQLVHSGNSTGPAAASAATAPLVTYATFGRLPDSLNSIEFNKGPHGDVTRAVNRNADLGTHMVLFVYPAGEVPKLPHFQIREQFTISAPPVNGRTAYWVTEKAGDPFNGGEQLNLLWQSADGQWILLSAYNLTAFFAEPMDEVHRVASDVTVAERAQPIPVRITDMPLRVEEAQFDRPMRKDEGTGAWQLRLFYIKDGPAFTILVQPEGSLKKQTDDGKAKELECRAAEGVEVCVTIGRFTDAEAIKELGGPQGVLDRFVPLGMDESKWVTN